MVVLHGLGQDERTGPGLERLHGEVGAHRVDDLLRHHHPRAVHERAEERRERRLQVELDGRRVDDLHVVHRAEVGGPQRPFRLDVAVDVPLHRVAVECRAVVVLDALAEMKGDGLAVGRSLPLLREPGEDVSLRIDPHERVVHRVVDVPIHEQA